MDKVQHAIRGRITSLNWYSEEEANAHYAHLVVAIGRKEARHDPLEAIVTPWLAGVQRDLELIATRAGAVAG